MIKTSIDGNIADQAAAILGATTLREIVNAKRRLEFVALLSEVGRFDFDAAEQAWGGDAWLRPPLDGHFDTLACGSGRSIGGHG